MRDIWIGNVKVTDKNRKLYSLNGKCFGSYGCFSDVFGGTVSAPVWANAMKAMSKGMEVKQFPEPSEKARRGNLQDLPNVFGRSPGEAQAILRDAGFPSQVGNFINSDAPKGTVGGTSPSGGALPGQTVTLLISSGPAAAQPDPQPTRKGRGRGGPTPPPPGD